MYKFKEIEINKQTNCTRWKIMILEENRKENHQIWSSYERVIPVINFKFQIKRERSTIYLLFNAGPYDIDNIKQFITNPQHKAAFGEVVSRDHV